MRVTTVAKSQKDQGTCIRCREPITKGQGYRWAKGRYSARRVIHDTCGSFQPSELTDNEKLGTLYAAQEAAHAALADQPRPESIDDCGSFIEDLTQILTDCGEQADEARQMYEDSADAIEEGFGHETSQSEEARENAETVQAWIDELEGVSFDDEPDTEAGPDEDDTDDEQALSDWADDAISVAEAAIDSLEL